MSSTITYYGAIKNLRGRSGRPREGALSISPVEHHCWVVLNSRWIFLDPAASQVPWEVLVASKHLNIA